MGFSDTFAPNGGRTVDTTHGTVTGRFRRFFVPEVGTVIDSVELEDTAVTLADFGLDVSPPAGVPFFLGSSGQSITSIEVTGKVFIGYANNDVRPDA